MNAFCATCSSTFCHVDRNEDGSPAIESTRCSHPGCEVYLCRAGCEHLSFTCEGCGQRFCSAHQVTIDELTLCLGCAVEAVESQEPECECSQTDVDLFDPRGCEYHDSTSPWNVRRRAVTMIQQYRGRAQGRSLRRRITAVYLGVKQPLCCEGWSAVA